MFWVVHVVSILERIKLVTFIYFVTKIIYSISEYDMLPILLNKKVNSLKKIIYFARGIYIIMSNLSLVAIFFFFWNSNDEIYCEHEGTKRLDTEVTFSEYNFKSITLNNFWSSQLLFF